APAACGGVNTAICVELSRTAPDPNVVPNFTVTFEDVKFEPVITTPIPPAMFPVAGETVKPVAACVTGKVTAPLVPPAVVTVTFRAPGAAFAAIVKLVVKCCVSVTVTEPTVTPLPLTATVVAPITKFVPVNVTGVTVVPVSPVFGETTLSVGAGVGVV